ncbi:DnaK suppressor protein [Bacteroides pyogenes JCM 6292]|uniref:Heparinase III protein n=2 Tax=Bacteroides pyogenes TaxID=310300 RepID=W4PH93_9BACE|nr:DnaK suppressor protein [Bacteroides pyogenes JCM 6292]GAE18783.1 heparinase III protein [Bacteroides pyogenes DSM 20611 = JCM 6294]
MDIKEQLKEIKTQLRLSMNGAVSQSMREKGLTYKLNFGVELPRIKAIAAGYEKSHDLAQAYGKKIYANAKFWRECCNPLILFIRRLPIFGWNLSGIQKLRN